MTTFRFVVVDALAVTVGAVLWSRRTSSGVSGTAWTGDTIGPDELAG
ncbi:MAG: hypothetical protein GX542_06335 [Rhodococcus sp.]|nr:hypothetical protein [Rhodococcus sp. (in: high G+C Gram-positive bacteria)]